MGTVRITEGSFELGCRGARDDVIMESMHALIFTVVGSLEWFSDELCHHDETDLMLDKVPEHE